MKRRLIYAAGDLAMSYVAMFVYNIARYSIIEDLLIEQEYVLLADYLSSSMVVLGQLCFPIVMLGIYWLSGYYNNVYRKSVLQEFATTFMSTFLAAMMVYFVALVNDGNKMQNYELLIVLWMVLVVCIYPVRLAITLWIKRCISQSRIEFVALVIGSGDDAIKCCNELSQLKRKLGYKVIGFVDNENATPLKKEIMGLPVYGIDEVEAVCKRYNVAELVVAPQEGNVQNMLHIIHQLFPLNLPIKVMAGYAGVFLSHGRLSTVYGTPMIDISCSNMSDCETNIKRMIDIVFSFVALIILLPFFVVIAVAIKFSNRGPVIFKQERVGLHGKPFTIYKFRTMKVDAETEGTPRLTSVGDERVFPLGHFMRKYRIDELPQFWNVLRGDMSIVGPRPERQYFIDIIMKRAPYYTMLHQVRPGITSFGMVKYGYASNVEEMIERMKFDIIYIENASLITDFKIVVYTAWTVLTGKGL